MKIKNLLSIILALCLTVFPVGGKVSAEAGATDSGTFGDNGNLSWQLDAAGTLTITGQGAMPDFESMRAAPEEAAPWLVYTDQIQYVRISEGVISIGSFAFDKCKNLKYVDIPDSVSEIGFCAFQSCRSLTDVPVSSHIENVTAWAYATCTNLTVGFLPEGQEEAGESLFQNCENMKSVILPASIRFIRPYAFYKCNNLKDVFFTGSEDEWKAVAIDQGAPWVLLNDNPNVTDGNIALTRANVHFNVNPNALELSPGMGNEYYSLNLPGTYRAVASTLPTWLSESGGTPVAAGTYTIVVTDGSGYRLATIPIRPSTSAPASVPAYTLDSAVKYAPYTYRFQQRHENAVFTINGNLPVGLTMSEDGLITGFPTELGVFSFTVTENYTGGTALYNCTLSVLWHGGVNVEQYNEPGYGFVETAADNGRIQNQYVTSVSELKSQTMHCEGAFPELYAVYLDARQLVRDVDYTAEEGSSLITVTDQALENAGNGIHVITAEFHEEKPGSAIQPHYTSQTFEIRCPGLASKDVQVYVKGVPVIWTDSEPYINTDSRTMVPLRPIAESLGLAVDWNADTREAIFMDYVTGKAIYFPLGNLAARTMEGAFVYMDTAAVSVNGRSYAPVRFLAEYFGYAVDWEGASRKVAIQ